MIRPRKQHGWSMLYEPGPLYEALIRCTYRSGLQYQSKKIGGESLRAQNLEYAHVTFAELKSHHIVCKPRIPHTALRLYDIYSCLFTKECPRLPSPRFFPFVVSANSPPHLPNSPQHPAPQILHRRKPTSNSLDSSLS